MPQEAGPRAPRPREMTLRKSIVKALEDQALTARDLSSLIGIPEKEVHDHLAHIRRSVRGGGQKFICVPAACNQCGFTFDKRERLTKPGRCPRCRGQSIAPPTFSLEGPSPH